MKFNYASLVSLRLSVFLYVLIVQSSSLLAEDNPFLAAVKNRDKQVNSSEYVAQFAGEERAREIQRNQREFDEVRQAFYNKAPKQRVLVWLRKPESSNRSISDIQDEVLSAATPLQVEYRLKSSAGLILTIDEAALDSLVSNSSVERIILDRPGQLHLPESRLVIGAERVEAAIRSTGHTVGEGVSVAVVDSGIDYTHPALGGCRAVGPSCRVLGGIDTCASADLSNPRNPIFCTQIDNDPLDFGGHGTVVTGVIGSSDNVIRGVAPNVNLLAVKAFYGPYTTLTAIARGVDWAVTNASLYNLRVINMSFGLTSRSHTEDSCPQYLGPQIQDALTAGISVIASSGNNGFLQGVTDPACEPGVISAAATYDAPLVNRLPLQPNPLTDDVTYYSNLPADVAAPGSEMQTTAWIRPPCNGTGSCAFSSGAEGTSFSAPHVAAVAAVLYQLNPMLTPAHIENILKTSGIPVIDRTGERILPRINFEGAAASKATPLIELRDALTIGKTVRIDLSDPDREGMKYIFALSQGTSPGIQFSDGRTIPLNDDPLLRWSLSNQTLLQNSIGQLGKSGRSQVYLSLPKGLAPGTTFYGAFVTYDQNLPYPHPIISISDPTKFTLRPFESLETKDAALPAFRAANPLDVRDVKCISNSLNNKIVCFISESVVSSPSTSTTNYRSRIVEYDPVADVMTNPSQTLPVVTFDSSCVTDKQNHKAYCFGGLAGGTFKLPLPTNKIIEYDFATGSSQIKNAVFPEPLNGTSCEYFAGQIFCFGGSNGTPDGSTTIYRYDPQQDQLTVMPSVLPIRIYRSSCVYSSFNNKISCIGGHNSLTAAQEVLEYDPVSGAVVTKNAKFYNLSYGHECAASPNTASIYCFGGKHLDPTRDIWAYDIALDRMFLQGSILPDSAYSKSCVTSGAAIYCLGGITLLDSFGGLDAPLSYLNTILKYED